MFSHHLIHAVLAAVFSVGLVSLLSFLKRFLLRLSASLSAPACGSGS